MIKAIEPLGRHDRAAFSCGVAALDDWFRLRAGQDEKRNVARIFVAIDDQRGIIGFYSLSSFTLAIADLPREHAKRLPRYDVIPAALIGRLARDETTDNRGLYNAHDDAASTGGSNAATPRRIGQMIGQSYWHLECFHLHSISYAIEKIGQKQRT